MRVFNGGTYDLLHAGHIFAFRQMRDMAGPDGEVIVSLNTDEFVARFKGHDTIQLLEERLEVLSAIRFIDRVIVNVGDEDSRPVLELVRPDIIAVGHDWWSQDDSRYCQQMGFTPDWLADRGIQLRYMAWMPERSSTAIRQRVTNGAAGTIMTHSGPLAARLAG
jgi:glycerol-3-phosphate cytidylyltransferase